MKKNKLLIVSLLALVGVCSCNNNNQNPTSEVPSSEVSVYVSLGTSEEEVTPSSEEKALNQDRIEQIINGEFEVLLKSVKTEEVVNFHTELQKNYLEDEVTNIAPYAYGGEERSKPLPLTLTWESNLTEENVVDYYKVNISENSDMTSSWEFKTNETSLDVYNLKVGTTYYWNVETNIKDLNFETETYTFETDDQNVRNIFVDGVTNCRDLGGWKIGTNQRVKQGLMYRTGRLNKNHMNIVSRQITAEGREMMTKYLNIKSEIDLRRTDNNEIGSLKSSPLGNTVNYYGCPMIYETNENTLVNNSPMLREIFKILSDENNYPLFYHCSIGTDRTGLLSYLVNGLLGVSEEDLYRDYLFSNFGNIGSDRELSDIEEDYIPTIKEQNGNSLSEKIENYLLGIGVTSEEISSIKLLMIETI